MSGARRYGRAPARRRGAAPAGLHLVSLMDIFTILVFFLLVNSSDVEVLEVAPDVRLPDSSAEQDPRPDLVVSVSAGEIRLNGTSLVTLSEVGEEREIGALAEALARREARSEERVTIMADRGTPYALLAKILKTCERAGHPAIAFAVNQRATNEDST